MDLEHDEAFPFQHPSTRTFLTPDGSQTAHPDTHPYNETMTSTQSWQSVHETGRTPSTTVAAVPAQRSSHAPRHTYPRRCIKLAWSTHLLLFFAPARNALCSTQKRAKYFGSTSSPPEIQWWRPLFPGCLIFCLRVCSCFCLFSMFGALLRVGACDSTSVCS